MDADRARARLRALRASGTFVIPNPFDVGSAKLLETLGAQAVATTSSGLASSLGTRDMRVTRDQLVAHVAALAPALGVPVHVDAEQCFPADPGGVGETARLLAGAGAAGLSIEDWDPVRGAIVERELMVERVATVVASGVVVTARCEHHLHGIDDLDATIERLLAYAEAGAEVLYAPGTRFTLDEVRAVVEAAPRPVNVLLVPGGPTVAELAAVGVRRVSTGGGLASVAYQAFVQAARHVLDGGAPDPTLPRLDPAVQAAAFGA